MTKKAVLDIGSLKLKVSIFDVASRRLEESDSILTLLGKDLNETGYISDDSLNMLNNAMQSVSTRLSKWGITDVEIIGTEALRSAENVGSVTALVEVYFPHHTLNIIEQHREAELFFTAVSKAFPDQLIVAVDIGGGSVQVIKGLYDTGTDKVAIHDRHNLPTGTYKLQQQFSPNNDSISTDIEVANKIIQSAFEVVTSEAPILVFGSSVMLDFIKATGIDTHADPENANHSVYVDRVALEMLLSELKTIQPNARGHFYPEGGYFMYGADYLLMNLIAAIDRTKPAKIYPTNLNTSYAFI